MVKSGIITAAGSGNRFGGAKQFKMLNGKPLYQHSLDLFLKSNLFDELILVVASDVKEEISNELKSKYGSQIGLVNGGVSRRDSVEKAIRSSNLMTDIVVVHDAARPFITIELIEKCISSCMLSDGAIIAIQPNDTVKYSENNKVQKTIDRSKIWLAQTPQAFFKQKILEAYESIENKNLVITDEATIMEKMGYEIAIVPGSEKNFKITTPNDWERAQRGI